MTVSNDITITNASNNDSYNNLSLLSTDSGMTNYVHTSSVNNITTTTTYLQQTLRRRVLRRNYRHPLLQ